MDTNFIGRLRNTRLPISHSLIPLFEAVVNSIHAIEDFGMPSCDGRISIEIFRNEDLFSKKVSHERGPDAKGDIIGFKIIDNGIGFNDKNMASFRTLDSDYKTKKGGRGIGRLLWLKAFKKAQITSSYVDNNGSLKTRSFIFCSPSGVTDEMVTDSPTAQQRETSVYLDYLQKPYIAAIPKTLQTIANSLLEHSLWYFLRDGGAPKIIICDGEDIEDLDETYALHMFTSSKVERFTIKDIDFELIHVKLRSSHRIPYIALYCAANRVVKKENLRSKIKGLYGMLSDDDGAFSYRCLVASSFLDENVRPERTDLDIDKSALDLLDEPSISFDDIQKEIFTRITRYLHDSIESNKQRGQERLEEFVAKRAPRYRPILNRLAPDPLDIDPDISDKDLDILLHKHLSEFENQIIKEGHDLMSPGADEAIQDYSARVQHYLNGVEDMKKSDLAGYVSHRRVVIDFLKNAIKCNSDGRYTREEKTHQLIMPMRTDSNEITIFESKLSNLWLINERLAFHDYLASDKTIRSMPITSATETKEPDLCCLQLFDNPILITEKNLPPFASLTIVEIKRPMRDDAKSGEDDDPIEQALGYLKRIRDGEVTSSQGRPIGNVDNIPGYCYILCDLTTSIIKRCNIHDLTLTSDGQGFFGYKKAYQAYIEVISFNQLVNSALERNKAFFDRLGLPTN